MIPHTTHFSGCDCVMDKIQKLEAENARLREALEFYSIPNKTDEWACEDFGPYEDSESEPGHIAREALRGDITPDKGGE